MKYKTKEKHSWQHKRDLRRVVFIAFGLLLLICAIAKHADKIKVFLNGW